MDPFGTATPAEGDALTLCYERRFPRPIATVWAALTQPERLADWLGACAVEPVVGGRFDVFLDREAPRQVVGRVLAWDAPHLLSFSWKWPHLPDTVVRIELAADTPQTTTMLFTHHGVPHDQRHLVLPGWHVYLERLGQALDGTKPDADFGPRFQEMQAAYADRDGVRAS